MNQGFRIEILHIGTAIITTRIIICDYFTKNESGNYLFFTNETIVASYPINYTIVTKI